MTQSALMTSQTTVMRYIGTSSSEPAATAYENAGAWSMNVFANLVDTSGAPLLGYLAHSCTKTYADPWCVRAHPLTTAPVSADPSTFFETTGTHVLHAITLGFAVPGLVPATQFSWYSLSGDTCPSGCATQTWTECTMPGGGWSSVDFPQGIYSPQADTKWIVYTGQLALAGFGRQIALKRLDSCTSSTDFVPNCTYWVFSDMAFARAAFDSNGKMHIIAYNGPNQLFHTTFDPSTSTWQCNYNAITSYAPAAGTCSTCPGVPTYSGIGDGCLRNNHNATIAIDTVSSPNNLMVALSTSSGSSEAQTQVWRSTSSGSSWSMSAFSASNSYHPNVTFQGTAGLFHIISLWDNDLTHANSTAAAVTWRTANGGASWALNYISDSYSPFEVPIGNSGCYFSDYEAVAADPGHSGVFYGWTESTSGSRTSIQGRIMNQ